MSAKNLIFYLFALTILLGLTTVVKGWVSLAVIPFWIGGLIGIFLPEIDHLIYAYFLHPHEYDSQRMQRMMNQGQIIQSVEMGSETRQNHRGMTFHNSSFQIIFLLFSLFVVTSTGSLLGRGIVLAFLLNLVIDQYFDLRVKGNIDDWLNGLKMKLTREQTNFYVLLQLAAIIILALLF